MERTLVHSEAIRGAIHGPAPQIDEVLRKYVTTNKCVGSILLVEDDETIRELTSKILEMRGYTVFSAENAEEGMRLFEEHKEDIELLVADISMPGMSGHKLVSRLKSQRDGLKTIFISGCDPSVVNVGMLDGDCAYLQKPFTMETLAHKVREMIDGVKYPGDEYGARREV